MKRLVVILCLVLAMAGCGGGKDLTADLQARYASMDTALAKKEVASFMQALDKQYTVRYVDGRQQKYDDIKASVSDLFKEASELQTTSTVSKVERKGDTAEADVTSIQKGKFQDAHGQAHQVEITTMMRDTWKKGKDGWVLLTSLELSHTTTRDGTRLPAPVKPPVTTASPPGKSPP